MRRRPAQLAAFTAALMLACAVFGVSVAGATAPHVARTRDTDACAICHRAHSAASTITIGPFEDGFERSALIGGSFPGHAGDTLLCFSCHDGLGATNDLLTDFNAESAHVLAPESSEFGPEKKTCGSCHDSHGTARMTGSAPDGEPYPRLLESVEESTGTVFRSGDAYCSACHVVREGNEFPGLDVWNQTAHAGIETAEGGTGVTCSVCHEPHGSEIAPLLRSQIATPAADTTNTVTGNDRSQCLVCHAAKRDTWVGKTQYATSGHAASDATVSVTAEWAAGSSEEATRAVGDCQTCHAAMGAVDEDGELIPALLREAQPASCRSCHSADGPAETDFASIAHRPGPGMLSVVAGFGGSEGLSNYGGLDVFSRQATDTAAVLGPRRFGSVGVNSPVVADFDGDGTNELVSAYATATPGPGRISVLGQDRNRGLTPKPGDVDLFGSDAVDLLAAGDVLDDLGDPLPELITAKRGDNFVQVYRWSGLTFKPEPVLAGGRLSLASIDPTMTITGMTVGSVSGSGTQIVLTVQGGDGGSKLVIVSGGTSGLMAGSPAVLRDGATNPVAFRREDVAGVTHDEIVVANSRVSSPLISIVNAEGSEVASAGVSADSSATAVWMGDVLPNVSGDELAVALAGDDGVARVQVFPAAGAGFASPQTVSLPASSTPVALASGDIDGDSVDELVVGLAGSFARDGKGAWPGVAFIGANEDGLALTAPELRATGAVEGAGSAGVVVADLGPIGPSRHPAGEEGSHTSTETATVESHVVCSDCHNPHSAKSDSTGAAEAPAVMGLLKGAWGVELRDGEPDEAKLADYEYEVCLKCHSKWSEVGQTVSGQKWPLYIGAKRSIAQELNTDRESFHPVLDEARENNSLNALEDDLEEGSQIYCTSCHGTSTSSGPQGPHTSPTAPLLKAPWSRGTTATAGPAEGIGRIGALCFDCHRADIYGTGSAETTGTSQPAYSGFFGVEQPDGDHKLHAKHTAMGFSCASCHVSHGSATLPVLLRDDTGWTDPAGDDAGACAAKCHTDGEAHAYKGPEYEGP